MHDDTGRAALAKIPVLEKQEAAEAQEDLVVPGVAAQIAGLEAGVVSSSTTRTGRPLRILRSPAEAASGAVRVDDTWVAPSPTTLQLFSPKHGVRTPTPDRVLLPAALHANTVDVLLDLFTSTNSILTTLVAPVSVLKWVTVVLQERGIDPRSLGVEAIGTTGYPLLPASRAWLTDAWVCPFFDNYSLSEIPSYASECGACGAMHWESDDVVLELCVPGTGVHRTGTRRLGDRTRAKVGELVVTTLVPSVLRMPLIRYATGDLVERTGRCATSGRQGFRWRGRIAHSLIVNGKVAVASGDLLAFGEKTADIAQHAHPAQTLGIVPTCDIGVPKILLQDGAIAAELRYDPARFPARAATVAVALRDACVVAGAVPLNLVRPGTLDLSQHARKL